MPFSEPNAQATDSERLLSLFGTDDVLPLWIAEPYVPLAQPVREAIEQRSRSGWYGYEVRPGSVKEAFWAWMASRHGWDSSGLTTIVSPSVGTSIGVLIQELTETGDGVIIQPPVFTDFKQLIVSGQRTVVRNPLILNGDGYEMDLASLAEQASDPATKLMILCNPHNPVGRCWTHDELAAAAAICAEHDVTVVADEIHADLVMGGHQFTPFAVASVGTGVRWAATHGPIKTFGLAGLCDTLLITDHEEIAASFKTVSNRLHLNRNNVAGLAAFEAAYRQGAAWLDDLLDDLASNAATLRNALTPEVRLMPLEATYLAWLDFRALGLDVPALASWLAGAGIAASPGHWFGREGAGFGRVSLAVDAEVVATVANNINQAVAELG